MIIYPDILIDGDAIGVTAPSSGVLEKNRERLEHAISYKKQLGYKVILGKCLHGCVKTRSASADDRAKDFMDLVGNQNVKGIIPPWGGELLIEILRYLDYDQIKKNPTWVYGYSDVSMLLFSITVTTNVASIHGLNLMDCIAEQSDPLSAGWRVPLNTNSSESFTQRSSSSFQKEWGDFAIEPLRTFNLTEKTVWKSLKQKKREKFSGRLLGGCIDVLRSLVGTPYGDVPKFAKQFDEPLLFYFENCEISPLDQARALWSMRYAGWFDNVSGFLIGRTISQDAKSEDDYSFLDSLQDALGDLNVPIIYDTDIGHVPPQLNLVNGAITSVIFEDGAGQVEQVYT